MLWLISVTEFRLQYTNTTLGYVWSVLKPFAFFGVIFLVIDQVLEPLLRPGLLLPPAADPRPRPLPVLQRGDEHLVALDPGEGVDAPQDALPPDRDPAQPQPERGDHARLQPDRRFPRADRIRDHAPGGVAAGAGRRRRPRRPDDDALDAALGRLRPLRGRGPGLVADAAGAVLRDADPLHAVDPARVGPAAGQREPALAADRVHALLGAPGRNDPRRPARRRRGTADPARRRDRGRRRRLLSSSSATRRSSPKRSRHSGRRWRPVDGRAGGAAAEVRDPLPRSHRIDPPAVDARSPLAGLLLGRGLRRGQAADLRRLGPRGRRRLHRRAARRLRRPRRPASSCRSTRSGSRRPPPRSSARTRRWR